MQPLQLPTGDTSSQLWSARYEGEDSLERGGVEKITIRGVPGFWHGSISGFSSAEAYFSGPDVTIIALGNSDSNSPSTAILMHKLAGIAFGMPYPIRRPTELPAAKLHELEGVYRIGANALRRISVKGNGLIVQRSGRSGARQASGCRR